MRAQSAIEYLVIAGIVMMFMVPLWIYVTTTQSQASRELAFSYAKNTVEQIADAASLVNSQGSPAMISIKVYVPEGLRNVSSSGRFLIFEMFTGGNSTSHVWSESNAIIQGSDEIPLEKGYYYLDITSHDSYVSISRSP